MATSGKKRHHPIIIFSIIYIIGGTFSTRCLFWNFFNQENRPISKWVDFLSLITGWWKSPPGVYDWIRLVVVCHVLLRPGWVVDDIFCLFHTAHTGMSDIIIAATVIFWLWSTGPEPRTGGPKFGPASSFANYFAHLRRQISECVSDKRRLPK